MNNFAADRRSPLGLFLANRPTIRLGGKLLDTQEVVTNKVVAAAARRQRFYPSQPKHEVDLGGLRA